MRTEGIVTSSALSPAKARARAVMVFASYRSEHVRTLFKSTQSQESKSEVGAHEFYEVMRIKTHSDNLCCQI